MAKIKNVSGEDRVVDGRLVLAGAVLEVPDADVWGYTCQEPNWAPADKKTETLHAAAYAAAYPPEPDAEPSVSSELNAPQED